MIILYFIQKKSKSNSDTISSADYALDDNELASLFNEKTKMIIINTPNNPMGKVYSRDELMKIADLCKRYNAICLSDEVTEWLVYDDTEYVRIASLPGMFERSITVGSGGKTFSVTGWKIGWAYGPANLLDNMQMVHQNCVYTCPTPIQVRKFSTPQFQNRIWTLIIQLYRLFTFVNSRRHSRLSLKKNWNV